MEESIMGSVSITIALVMDPSQQACHCEEAELPKQSLLNQTVIKITRW